VSGVPLGRFPKVSTAIALDATHRVHGVVDGFTVTTEPAVFFFAGGCSVRDEERSARSPVTLVLGNEDCLTLFRRMRSHTYSLGGGPEM